MGKEVNFSESDVREITRLVVEVLQGKECSEPSAPIGVSNRHVYLNRADMDFLFGNGTELTVKKMLGQPGEFSAEETVILRGPKGEIEDVRVIGPIAAETQIAISLADGCELGVEPPVREPGKIENTPGLEIIGPCGSVKKDGGVIAEQRHIYMSPTDATKWGVKDGQSVCMEIKGPRGAILSNVLVRVSDNYALKMYIDVEEANALGVKNGDRAYYLSK